MAKRSPYNNRNSPPSGPPSTPPPKREQITLKGSGFGVDFRNLINRAAAKSGETQNAFVHRVLTAEAQRVLRGTPPSTPPDSPPDSPQVPVVVPDGLEEMVKRLMDDQASTITQRVLEELARKKVLTTSRPDLVARFLATFRQIKDRTGF